MHTIGSSCAEESSNSPCFLLYPTVLIDGIPKSKILDSENIEDIFTIVKMTHEYDPRSIALNLYMQAVESVLPGKLVYDSIGFKGGNIVIQGQEYELGKRIWVFGAGKASCPMAKAIEEMLGERIAGGVIASTENSQEKLEKIEVLSAGHPLPDEESVRAGKKLREQMRGLTEDDFFLFLLSGGASSLLEQPLTGITLEDMRKTTDILLKNNVDIQEINTIRKHLSWIKGGRLGEDIKARGAVLVISDVVGDKLEAIGSGLLYRDTTTYSDCWDILEKNDLLDRIPDRVKKTIEKGTEGKIRETPEEPRDRIKHHIIGNNQMALEAAGKQAEKMDLSWKIVTSELTGEAREQGKKVIQEGKKKAWKMIEKDAEPPIVLLYGGETTVDVKGEGQGGRNQEMCLSALKEIDGREDIVFFAAGTDGIDGNSPAAGAVVDHGTYQAAKEMDLDIDKFLERNDSFNFLMRCGSALMTGETGTNVMDMMIFLYLGNSHP